ncbi:MAG: amidohydrolase family protein [Candidatus Koribacter versatilis]|uniref:Amidohydrolase family protein n=1 Tax=Candidatus Korobacter versatilis TaxID=658062 RepID=A0A932A851_9BACT|nr:amidohydrolase family protein [Candidatus Koribacter versatilis]
MRTPKTLSFGGARLQPRRHAALDLFRAPLGAALAVALLLSPAFAQKAPKPASKKPAAAPAPTPLPPAPLVAIKGGKVVTVSHGIIENGVVVMEGGKLTAVGAAGTAIPKGARVIDATGMWVYPGLFDSETRLGLTEIQAVDMTNDTVEISDEIMPHMHVYDAFHAETEHIPISRMNGITNAIVAPTSEDTLPGQDSLIQLWGPSGEEMLMVKDIAMPLNLTGEQRRRGGRRGGEARFPSTRMGLAAQLRQAFIDALDYKQKWDDYNKGASKPADAKSADSKDKDKKEEGKKSAPKRDLKLEALLPYLEGRRPVIVEVQEPTDLYTALGLAREFKLRVVLKGLTHAQITLDQIAAAKVPVIVGPIYEQPKEDERYDAVYSLPAQLHARGVKVAFASYDDYTTIQPRNLPYEAGYAVAFGLPWDEAMRAVTLSPAEIWGVADQLGSLDPGKVANVVVANGDPLDVKSDVKHVFIAGREVPLESRQTRLRDEYMKR